MAGVNSDPRTAQNAGRHARHVVRNAVGAPPEKLLGPAAPVTLSPEAQAVLATKGEGKGSSATVVAASCALVLKGAGFFNKRGK